MKTILSHVMTAVLMVSALSSTNRIVAQEENVPLIFIDNVPLTDAIKNVARYIHLNIIFDPHVPGSEFGPGRSIEEPSIHVRWTNITARTAFERLLKENKLAIITNAATSVVRIVPSHIKVTPMPATQVETNLAQIIPTIAMDSVSLNEAVTKLARDAGITVSFDARVSSPRFQGQGTVSFSWEKITARQALIALLDNYGLAMIETPATSSARIAVRLTL